VSHYEDMLALYGTESGLRQARKHLGWYLDRHAPGTEAGLRSEILRSLDPASTVAGLRRAFLVAAVANDIRSAA
jgi:tRNA-dihydrouridine synthase